MFEHVKFGSGHVCFFFRPWKRKHKLETKRRNDLYLKKSKEKTILFFENESSSVLEKWEAEALSIEHETLSPSI